MPDDRLIRILLGLPAEGPEVVATAQLCALSAHVTAVSGAGLMLLSAGVPQGSIGSSNEVSRCLEDLQYTVGEGPCVDAWLLNAPVAEPNLADTPSQRWMAFTPAAVEMGVRAVFGFPVCAGAARLGALSLYNDRTGPLTSNQHQDAVVMAGLIGRAVIGMQADAPTGGLARALTAGTNFGFVVHQASGMVASQLGVGVGEALIRLRAYAFSNDRLVSDVARDVVRSRLTFPIPGDTAS